mmetsp:Transcript_47829/g.84192  ORF Transcript_47829/g.84192 Transcript_47829/m.84192 type:complete len:109 (-) Transcript_47829:59-385(-)
MPCNKDLALAALPNGVVQGSALVWSSYRLGVSRSSPDLRTWDPSHTRSHGKLHEFGHHDVLRRSAERHLLRPGQPAALRCDPTMEESRWFRRLQHPDATPASKKAHGQ